MDESEEKKKHMTNSERRIEEVSHVYSDAVDETTQEAVLEKYDREAAAEKKSITLMGRIIGVLGAFLCIYVIITCAYRAPEAIQHRAIFLSFCLPLVFMVYPAFKHQTSMSPKWYDWILIAAVLVSCGYIIINSRRFGAEVAMAGKTEQYLFVIMVLCVLEAVRRVAGKGMVIIIAFFLIYAYGGRYFPGILAHPGLSFRRMATYLYMGTGGLFGTTIGTAAGMVALFITFASFMEKTGVGSFINNLALSLVGGSAGGPAKVAVVTSALFGTISGNAVSNVVTTGAFTIPLMKKTGYKPEFAGAVEAVASTGGQLMPPIMGASAFVMADITGTPYSTICLAAVVPVLLYYLGCFTMVHLRAQKIGLKGVTKDKMPNFWHVLRTEGYLFIPFVYVVGMLMMYYTVTYVGVRAIPVAIIVAAFKKQSRLSIKDIWEILKLSGRRILSIGATCCGISMIMGVCNLTGITQTLSSVILNLTGGLFVPTILLIAAICIVMGMGLPTVSVYMLLSTVAAPALIIGFNVPLLAAHFYVFYFGLLANVTPPVCLPAYAAAGLADSDPTKTAWAGFVLALGGFIVPFIFIYSPDILFINATWLTGIKIITAIIGVAMLSSAVEGWMFTRMPLIRRIILAAGAMGMVIPELYTDVIGISVTIIIILMQKKTKLAQTPLAA